MLFKLPEKRIYCWWLNANSSIDDDLAWIRARSHHSHLYPFTQRRNQPPTKPLDKKVFIITPNHREMYSPFTLIHSSRYHVCPHLRHRYSGPSTEEPNKAPMPAPIAAPIGPPKANPAAAPPTAPWVLCELGFDVNNLVVSRSVEPHFGHLVAIIKRF